MRRQWIALGGLLLSLFLCLPALAAKVSEVKVEGLAHVNRVTVDGILRTRKGADYSPDIAHEDLARIVSTGFFDPAQCSLDPSNDANGVTVTFRLKENPVITQVVVRGVSVPGVDPAKVQEIVTSYYLVGKVYNLNTAGLVASEVARLYDDAGYEATLRPPTIDEAGNLIVIVLETTIEDVRLSVWPQTDAIDLDQLVQWIGLRLGSPLHDKQLGERRNALMGLGLFSYLAVDLVDGEEGVVVRFSAVLNDYPVPSAEALPFIDPAKLLQGLAVYRVAPQPDGMVGEPRPTPQRVAALAAQAQAAPQDGSAAARVAFALCRLGKGPDALTAAAAAQQLLAAATDKDSLVLRARLSLLQGDPAGAFAMLSPLRQDGSLPPDGYPALIEAAVTVLADSAVTDPAAARVPGDTLSWTIRTLIGVADPQALLATEKGTEYASALAGAWTYFQRMDEGAVGKSFVAFERYYRLLSLLEYLPPALTPSTIVPDSAADIRKQIPPIYENARLTAALRKRTDDPAARAAWANLVIQRQLAVALCPPDAVAPEEAAAYGAELPAAVQALTELLAADPAGFAGSQAAVALGLVLQKEDERAFEMLIGLMDGAEVPDADHLFLLAASIATTRDAQSDDQVKAAMLALADRLNPVIADGKPHPRARYARYSLLAWATQIDKALEEARAATQALDSDQPAWASVGFFEAQKGNWDAAEQALVKATTLDPQDVHAAYMLGLARWGKSGDGAPSLPLLTRLNDVSRIDIQARDLAF